MTTDQIDAVLRARLMLCERKISIAMMIRGAGSNLNDPFVRDILIMLGKELESIESNLKLLPAIPKAKRVSISQSLRQKILARDGGACHYCGSKFDLTIDHKRPVSNFGDNSEENLVVACWPCNFKKRAIPYATFISKAILCSQ